MISATVKVCDSVVAMMIARLLWRRLNLPAQSVHRRDVFRCLSRLFSETVPQSRLLEQRQNFSREAFHTIDVIGPSHNHAIEPHVGHAPFLRYTLRGPDQRMPRAYRHSPPHRGSCSDPVGILFSVLIVAMMLSITSLSRYSTA